MNYDTPSLRGSRWSGIERSDPERKLKGLQTTRRFRALRSTLKRFIVLEYIMPLLSDQTVIQKANYRVKTAGTKLNRDELAALAKHCSERGTTPGELIRQLILE
jgi:hypothetical protein